MLGSKINIWLKETYNKYGVRIEVFASEYLDDFFNDTHEYTFDRIARESCEVKSYDYKGKENLFSINELYEDVKDKPFIYGRKLELEILFMHVWLHSIVGDKDGYWHEYITCDTEIFEIINS